MFRAGLVLEALSALCHDGVTSAQRRRSAIVRDGASDVDPDEASDVVSDETSDVDPDEASDVDPDETSDVDPDETSDVDPDETSDVVPDEASDIVPDEASDVVSDEASDVDPDEASDVVPDGHGWGQLTIHDLIPLALCGDTSCHSRSAAVSSVYQDGEIVSDLNLPNDIHRGHNGGISIKPPYNWKKEHLDERFNYDFTKLRDTKQYSRGGEKYKRPCGWQRFALKVLDKFGDNTWLGNTKRSTRSVRGEWPVSYHGTQEKFVKAIIEGGYKKGGPGIYFTPDVAIAEKSAVEFTSKRTGKKYKTVLQNRINPKYRKICDRKHYWLVRIPKGTSKEKEKEIVRKAIRPYGLLVKEV